MCGVVGILGQSAVNQTLYDALTVLQHRGQDAAGMVTLHRGKMIMRKANGLVRDVFQDRHMVRLAGNIGIAHVRYPTAGCASSAEAQPFYVNSPYGITLAHNGNLTNAEQLKEELYVSDKRHINTNSDSEVLLNILAHELQKVQAQNLNSEHIFTAMEALYERCRGGYVAVAQILGVGMLFFRDPHGIRPLVFGSKKTDKGIEYMVASESVALDSLGFSLERDVAPGEAVFVDIEGNIHHKVCAKSTNFIPCIFEHVYLARPDSMIDNVSVYKARLRMGEKLAERIEREWSDHDIDVVIPIPDTSTTSAMQLAHGLGIKMRHGFVKNRYIGRTFIMPGQKQRKKSVRNKLNAIGLEFKDKNVLLVDDSIVRGTTSQQIVELAREAGANKVYFASASPPIRYPNVYGIDMPTADELVAHGKTVEDITDIIGADKLIYQSIDDLVASVQEGNPSIKQFDLSVFNGQYLTGDIDKDYLDELAIRRNDLAKESRLIEEGISTIMDLHNEGHH